MGEKHVLTVPGRYAEIKNIVRFVADGAEEAGLNEDAIFHVELCCDEACTNIIEHAYGAEDVGPIKISYEVDRATFRITIKDQGRPFDLNDIPPPPAENMGPEEAIDNLKVGGLGIHFMRKLMDEVRFDFDHQKGNTLTMVKKIPGEEAP
jgi:serine/threonine-protein kinase RsbW